MFYNIWICNIYEYIYMNIIEYVIYTWIYIICNIYMNIIEYVIYTWI